MTVMIAPINTRTRVRSKATATKRAVQRAQQPIARPSIHQQAPQTYEAQAVQRAMSVSNLATPIGTNFFDRCGDEIMSLHYGQQLDLLDWMGFEVSDTAYRVLEFIAYNRAALSGGNPTAGHLSDPCEDPNGIEYGTAKLTVENFGRYGRKGPDREIMKPKRYCATDPIRRLDGEVVTSESEWDLRFAVDAMIGDIRRDLITGNASVSGQFDGLEAWVKTSYTGPNADVLKSTVIDWNGNPMAGGAGVTWNGAAIASKPGGGYYNLIDVLLPAWRRIHQRMMWTRQLQNQRMRLGDAIILLPTMHAQCLLDHFTCWSVCPGGEYSPVNLQQMEARKFRNELVRADNPNNLFGYGYITLDNTTFPLMAYDPGLIKGPTRGDIYMLFGSVGGVRLWEGEHLSAAVAASEFGDHGYTSVDGGRILTLTETENECFHLKAWMHPRLFCRAPWAQVRFMDVVCSQPGGPLSGDPNDTSFFYNSSFTPATIS